MKIPFFYPGLSFLPRSYEVLGRLRQATDLVSQSFEWLVVSSPFGGVIYSRPHTDAADNTPVRSRMSLGYDKCCQFLLAACSPVINAWRPSTYTAQDYMAVARSNSDPVRRSPVTLLYPPDPRHRPCILPYSNQLCEPHHCPWCCWDKVTIITSHQGASPSPLSPE